MPTHRRGRSLSDGLTLEESEDGGLVISSIDAASSGGQGLSKGDEIVGAAINFDDLSKEDVMSVLKLMEPFEDKVQVLTKNNLSKSLGNLDRCTKTPGEMLQDSYNKLFKTKIRRFMKNDPFGSENDGERKAKGPAADHSNLSLKGGSGLPQLGVDFGIRKTEKPRKNTAGADGITFSAPKLNAPGFGVRTETSRTPALETNSTEKEMTGLSFDVNAPKVELEGTHKKSKMPKFNIPDLGLSGANLSGQEIEGQPPEINPLEIPSGALKVRPSQKLRIADLNVDDPSGYAAAPKVRLSGKLPKRSDVDLTAPQIDVPDCKAPNFKGPEFDFSGTDVDTPSVGNVKTLSPKWAQPKFKMPNFDLSDPRGIKLDGDLVGPDLNLAMPKYKSGIAEPNIEINLPSADLKRPSMDIDRPSGKFSMTKFGVSSPKVKGPDHEIKLKGGIKPHNFDLKDPEVDLYTPGGSIKMPTAKLDIDTEATSSKVKMPKLKLFGMLPKKKDMDIDANMKTPNLTLKSQKIKGVEAPDINLPNMDIKPPSLDLRAVDVNTDFPKGKLKMPTLKVSEFDPSGPNMKGLDSDFKAPDLNLTAPKIKSGIASQNLNMPDIDLSSPKIDLSGTGGKIDMPSGKFKMPTMQKPKIHLNNPEIDINAPKLTMPKFGISGSPPEGPKVDVNADLKSTDFSLNVPKIKGGIGTPHLALPKMDINAPKLDVSTPDIGTPKTKFKMPSFDMDAPSGKLKMPEFGLSGTMPKGQNLDMDADLKTKGFSLKAPKIKGGIDTPDLDLPKIDLKSPQLNVDTPDMNIGSPKAKFKMPKLKMPKFNLPGFKGPDVDLDGKFDSPELNANMPNVNLKGPKGGFNIPSADFDSPSMNFKKPNLKMPNFGLSAPKFDSPNFDVKSPDLNLSGPKMSGGLGSPDLSMPKVDLKSPKLDLNVPDINMPSAKLNMPTLTKPRAELSAPNFNIDAPSGNLKMPKFGLSGTMPKGPNLDIDADLKTKGLSLKAPKIMGGIDTPDLDLPKIDLKSPKLNVGTPDMNIGSPKAKFKMPKLKMPKFNLPGFKGPDVDLDGKFDSPELNANMSNVNLKGPKGGFDMPGADFDSPSMNFKKPNLKMPNFAPKFESPNFDVMSPDLNLSGPKMSSGLGSPDLSMPKVDLKSPKLDLNVPDINMPSAKLNMPTLTKPRAELSAPNINIDAPSGNLKMPEFGLSGTMPKGPNLDMDADLKTKGLSLKAPKIKGGIDTPDLDLPKIDLKSPKLNVGTPDMNIGSPKAKFKMPKLKMPKFNLLGFKGPDVDLDGKFDSPELNANMPNVNLKGPKGGFDMPGADFDSPSMNFKKPNLKMPNFAPKFESPNFDVKSPDLNLSGPKMSGGLGSPDLSMPKVDLKSPQLDLNVPDINTNFNIDAPSGNLKMPKFGLSGTMPKGPNLDLGADLKSPDLSLKAPKVKGGIKGPQLDFPKMDLKAPNFDVNTPAVNISSPEGDFKVPQLKMPKISPPNIKGLSIDGGIGGQDVEMPRANIKVPKAGFEMPHGDFGSPSAKLKKPKLKIPAVGFSAPKFDGPNVDFKSPDLDVSLPKGPIEDMKMSDLSLRAPKLKSGENIPDLDLKAPMLDVQTPNVNLGSPKTKLKMSKGKMPKFDMSSPKGPGVDINGGLRGPDLNIPNVDFDSPKFQMPNLGVSGPKGPDLELNGIEGPDINFSAPGVKAGIPGSGIDVIIPSGDIQGPQTDLDLHDRKFKLPSFTSPEFGNPGLGRTMSDIDLNAVLRSPNPDISPPNAKLNMKPPHIKGNSTTLGSPNVDLNLPKADVRNHHPNVKAPGLDIDAPSLQYNSPSYKNRRSDTTGTSVKMPVLDIDADVKLRHHGKMSSKSRSSFPLVDADLPRGDLDPGVYVPGSDLNIDDFTGKTHVPRARASRTSGVHNGPRFKAAVQRPELGFGASLPGADANGGSHARRPHREGPAAGAGVRARERGATAAREATPETEGGYLVTVFPRQQQQHENTAGGKAGTLGRPDFRPSNVDLEVPGQDDAKGSTFWFSKLI